MAIKITDVKIITNYSWQDINESADWNTIKNTNANWQQPLQITQVGEQIRIEVDIVENNWSEISSAFTSWAQIKNSITNWLGLKNR